MRARFHAEPIIQATELLLQERTPRDVAVARPRAEEVKADASVREIVPPTQSPLPFAARPDSAHASAVERQVHGDDHRGRLGLQPLARPGGHALARGRRPAIAGARTSSCATCDSGEVWSAGYQPSGVEPDSYEVDVLRGSRRDRPARRHASRPRWKWRSRPRTTPRFGACRSTNLGSRARARSS